MKIHGYITGLRESFNTIFLQFHQNNMLGQVPLPFLLKALFCNFDHIMMAKMQFLLSSPVQDLSGLQYHFVKNFMKELTVL